MGARGILLGIAVALSALPLCGVAADRKAGATEYRLKAVFLYNFTQFVEWPDSAFADAQSPFTLCLLGHDPFGQDLEEVTRGESVGSHPLRVLRIASVADLPASVRTCQVLFIGEVGAREQVMATLSALPAQALLIVADADKGLEAGVMIGFARDKQRIRLRIDNAAARAAGLTVSSKLLRLGT